MKKLLAATAFLTGIPIRTPGAHDPASLRAASGFFPVVGLIIGFFLAGIYFLSSLLFSPVISALLVLGGQACITLCLHLDGFAGVAEALGGKKTRDEALRSMNTHHIGVFGITALFILLAIKTAALEALAGGAIYAILIIAPAISRWSMLGPIWKYPHAEGTGPHKILAISGGEYFIATVFILALSFIVSPSISLYALIISGAAAFCAGKCITLRVGGVTKDTYGFLVELTELVFLLSWIALR